MHQATLLTFVLLAARLVHPSDAFPQTKPVPAMQVLPLPEQQASFQREGRELMRVWANPSARRPFLYPLVGPAGRSLTRMGHPHDPTTHSHHNSVWIAHRDIGGVNFWEDGKARIVQERVEKFDDGAEQCSMLTLNAWKDAADKTLLREWRRVTVQPQPEGEWLLTIESELSPPAGSVVLGKTPFGLLGVRMAKTIGVTDGGGEIRNSEGDVNEPATHWKRAKWVDYAGPIAEGTIEGIALLDHPDNPGHPSYFHTRNDGWMGASLTYAEPRELAVEKPLRVAYRLYVHRGKADAKQIQTRWDEFAKLKLEPLAPKK